MQFEVRRRREREREREREKEREREREREREKERKRNFLKKIFNRLLVVTALLFISLSLSLSPSLFAEE